MVDAMDSKPIIVRCESSSLSRGTDKMNLHEKVAYLVGVALGDGNLTNPNGRALRLRITCDTQYPNIISEILDTLKIIFPENKITLVKRKIPTCLDISVYSNKLSSIIPWEQGLGTKLEQKIRIPIWIMNNPKYRIQCLRGLLHTDGSLYTDRGYLMLNFTNLSIDLINDVNQVIGDLGYKSRIYKSIQPNGKIKYVVRLSKDVQKFIDGIKFTKS